MTEGGNTGVLCMFADWRAVACVLVFRLWIGNGRAVECRKSGRVSELHDQLTMCKRCRGNRC